MRTSHSSPDTYTRTSNLRTTESNTWTDGKTPWNHKDDPRMQIKKLLPKPGKKDPTMGIEVRRLHQIQKNQQLPNQTKTAQQHRTRSRTKGHPRNRHPTKPTQFSRLPKHYHHDRCVFTLPIRLPTAERDGQNKWTMHC